MARVSADAAVKSNTCAGLSMRWQSGWGVQIAPARFTIGSMNIEQRRSEARRKEKSAAKREKRAARRREKGAPQAGSVKS